MKPLRRRRRIFKAFLPRKFFIGGLVLVLIGLLGVLWYEFFLDHAKLTPKTGGIYTEATIGEIRNLNPLSPVSSSFDRDLQQLIFAGLLRYDPLRAEVVEGLGTIQTTDQGKLHQVTLHPEARFSDGSSVDIADVLFTFETLIKNPQFRNEGLRESFEYVDISVVDDRTIAFRLPEQNVFFPYLLTTPILPQKYFEDLLLEEVLDPDLPYNRRPVGAGPFRINNIVPEDGGLVRVFLERNPDYYLGTPYIEEIVFYVYADAERLKLGHNWPTLFTRLPFREVEPFAAELFDEYKVKQFYQPRFAGLFFNLDQPIASNVHFRRALKNTLNLSRFLEEDWEPIDSPFFFEDIPGLWPGADPDGARATLRDNGFPYNRQLEARTFERQGPAVRVKMITSLQPAVYSRMAQNIKNTWESELDIEVDLQVLDPEEFQIALRDRLYDVVLFGQDFSRNLDNLSVWHSSQTDRLNLSNVTRDDIDFLVEEIRFSGARSDYLQLQERMDVIVPAIMLATPNHKLLYAPTLKAFDTTWGRIRHLADRFAYVHTWHFLEQQDWDWPENRSKLLGFFRWLISGKTKQTFAEPVIETEIPVEDREAVGEPEAETDSPDDEDAS